MGAWHGGSQQMEPMHDCLFGESTPTTPRILPEVLLLTTAKGRGGIVPSTWVLAHGIFHSLQLRARVCTPHLGRDQSFFERF